MKKLLIVESPAKAKTIGKYLGNDFIVKSSVGHIRDLPPRNDSIKIMPEGENSWSFQPSYIVSEGKEKVVKELKHAVEGVDQIYLASDPDREGEAIAWHLYEVLSPVAGNKPFHRVAYHEITKAAVSKAVANPGRIDMGLVDAQQARRILDRLVGFNVSPILWRSIPCPNPKTLAAGRVQSVALRLLVERQREIDSFVPEVYFLMGVEAKKLNSQASFVAKLSRLDGEKPEVKNRQAADTLLLDLVGAELEVSDLKEMQKTRNTLPPFTTSTLQQAASSALAISPGKTMKAAQTLYEQGLITYMRTDSLDISEVAREAAKNFIVSNYGEKFYPSTPNIYKAKDGAQEAHEAIRPTDVNLLPQNASLDATELKVYDLIWRRFVASQMAPAKTTVKTVSLLAQKPGLAHTYLFTASATEVTFEGFLKVMKMSLKKKTKDGEDEEDTDEVLSLPPLTIGEKLEVVRWISDEKKTKGPSYYSEASLIKVLEENGVGRPSTYATIIEKLKQHEYAKNEKRKLVPLDRGILVWNWLEKKLESLFNVGFTASMEAELDKIAEEGVSMNSMLSSFYVKFKESLAASADPVPEARKFELLFKLLQEVKTWKEPKKYGKKIYDDKAFVESVKKQMDAGRALTVRQFDSLVKMVSLYADQIPGAENTLRENGIGAGASFVIQKADPDLSAYCFDVMLRIGGMLKNPFLKSIYEQFQHSHSLSVKQFSVLARSVAENASSLPDCEEIREKLNEFLPKGFTYDEFDPVIPKLIEALKEIKTWRQIMRRGKKIYNDKEFVKSLVDQFKRRHQLSTRQIMALRRVIISYKDQISNYDSRTKELGLDLVPSFVKKSEEKEVETESEE